MTYAYCPDCSNPMTRLRRVGVSKRNVETYYVCPSCEANWTRSDDTNVFSYGAKPERSAKKVST